jgi:hypothetical protein
LIDGKLTGFDYASRKRPEKIRVIQK